MVTRHEVITFLISMQISISSFFFFNDTATTEIYTLSLHDALPISPEAYCRVIVMTGGAISGLQVLAQVADVERSEEHTSELQSQSNLVCRLLLEKKKEELAPHDSLPSSKRCIKY